MAKNVATVEDFEKLRNDVGLVPMKFLRATIGEFVGDVRGAEPYTALRWYNEGLAEPVGKLSVAPAQKPAPAPSADDARKSGIVIPENWRGQHHLTNISLAKEITGSDEKLTKEQAEKIIEAEVARRDAGTGGGLTSLNTPTP